MYALSDISHGPEGRSLLPTRFPSSSRTRPLDDLAATLGFPCGAAVAATADLPHMSSFPWQAAQGAMKQSHIISRNAAEIVAILASPGHGVLEPAHFICSNWRLEILSSARTKGLLSHSSRPADSVPLCHVFRVGGLSPLSISRLSPTSWRPLVATPCLLRAF